MPACDLFRLFLAQRVGAESVPKKNDGLPDVAASAIAMRSSRIDHRLAVQVRSHAVGEQMAVAGEVMRRDRSTDLGWSFTMSSRPSSRCARR